MGFAVYEEIQDSNSKTAVLTCANGWVLIFLLLYFVLFLVLSC